MYFMGQDERYLALGYDGASDEEGCVVIFDLVKHKPHRSYQTQAAITTMAWHHTGEQIFVGTYTVLRSTTRYFVCF